MCCKSNTIEMALILIIKCFNVFLLIVELLDGYDVNLYQGV